MPFWFQHPNCGRLTYQGRDVILCFGSRNGGRSMHALDLKTETWSDLNMDAPAVTDTNGKQYNTLYASSVFIEGNRLYRLRGENEDNYKGTQRLDGFDPELGVWMQKLGLPQFNIRYHWRVMLKVKVVLLK